MRKLITLVAVLMLGVATIGCNSGVDNTAVESDHKPDTSEAPTNETSEVAPNDPAPPPPAR